MVTEQSVREQLERIGFKQYGWGKAEVRELPHILLADEEIFECVNGIYEGGFALLIATDVRVLLIDKKPLNYLTVEDLRFDMINEIDYSHRLLGAYISITSGDKNLKFRSYNQMRLRKLITHVQHCMADSKKKQHTHQEGQNQHLEQINQQLQAYLMAQHEHQRELREHLKVQDTSAPRPEPVKPSPELSDYLYAQSLLAQYRQQTGQDQTVLLPGQPTIEAAQPTPALQPIPTAPRPDPAQSQIDIYADGMKEVFGKHSSAISLPNPLEINPLRIAYSKLPMVLRNRKFAQHPPFKPGGGVTPEVV